MIFIICQACVQMLILITKQKNNWQVPWDRSGTGLFLRRGYGRIHQEDRLRHWGLSQQTKSEHLSMCENLNRDHPRDCHKNETV